MYPSLDPPVMTQLQQLQQDHAAMREKLQQLKAALNGGSPRLSQGGVKIQQETRQLCAALSEQLRAHIRQEERLAARCSMALGRMGREELARFALEHHADEENLRIINQSLAHEGNGWVTHAGPLLLGFIASLRRQLEAQEANLFPFFERVLGVEWPQQRSDAERS